MDEFLLIGLFLLIFIGIPIGIGWFIFWSFKRAGHPKVAKLITATYVILILSFATYVYFEDELFSESDAKNKIANYEFHLVDKFELIENRSISAIGDYYHTFTIKISDLDKKKIISKIKNDNNFGKDKSLEFLLYDANSRYFGQKTTSNYEDKDSYIYEYFEPSGKEGYAALFIRIRINKDNNELVYENIDP